MKLEIRWSRAWGHIIIELELNWPHLNVKKHLPTSHFVWKFCWSICLDRVPLKHQSAYLFHCIMKLIFNSAGRRFAFLPGEFEECITRYINDILVGWININITFEYCWCESTFYEHLFTLQQSYTLNVVKYDKNHHSCPEK